MTNHMTLLKIERYCSSHSTVCPKKVTVRSEAWVCDHSLPGIAGSNPAWNMGCLSVVSVVCCQAQFSASGRSLVQRRPTECVVCECDLGNFV